MKLERSKNAVRNIRVGMLNKFITILCPFILRTIIIKTLGTDYLGLSSLFKSVLQVLSLSELGIGSAMVFNMYKPIAEGDEDEQAALLIVYKKIYRIIGSIIFLGGLTVLPFLKYMIHGNTPDDVNIYFLYILYILNSSESYFISAYRTTVLSAYQRRDIIQKIGLSVNILLYSVQIVCLLLFKNYYLYVIWLPVFTMIENIVSAKYVEKHYPELFGRKEKPQAAISRNLLRQVRDLFGHKLSNVVTNSVDTLIISAFLGLSMVTIYNNYFYLISAFNGVLDIVYQAILAGIGNSLELETQEKNRMDFWTFYYSNSWVVGWASICFLCLYQPMMTLWMGEELLLKYSSVVLLALYFYVWKMRQPIMVYKDASGIWHEDRIRPYIEIIVNLVVNIVLVKIIGINGIIISTIVSMAFVSWPWEVKAYIKKTGLIDFRDYMARCLKSLLLTGVIAIITRIACSAVILPAMGAFFVRLCICAVIPNMIYFIVYRKNIYIQRIINIVKDRIFVKSE